MKRFLSLVLVLLMTVSLFSACGAGSTADSIANGSADFYGGDTGKGEAAEDGITSGSTAGGDSSQLPQSSKLIRKLWLSAETEELDPLLAQVDARITELEGYVESRQIYHGSPNQTRRNRSAEIVIRIPADKMGEFAATVSENANVTSSNETTENITLQYVATQSRITALETEQTRLLELLAKAETMDDLLQIEERLTDVRTELEKVTSQLRVYDNLVDYSTIYLNLSEVKEYTVVEEPETVWERISTGFMKSLKDLGNFLVELFILIVVALPWLIPIGLIITAVILLSRFRRKKKDPPPTPKEDVK